MEPFITIAGRAAPMPAPNIDTDVIMPKQFLKRVDREGLSRGVFFDQKYLPGGAENPEFVLNKPAWRDPTFLVVGPNFGCGSSREHAVWGLAQAGIRGLLGTSFSGIFFDNCARNGMLAASVDARDLDRLVDHASDPARNYFEVDLPMQQIRLTGSQIIPFSIAEDLKGMLMSGLDLIGHTLSQAPIIRAFEDDHLLRRPWLR